MPRLTVTIDEEHSDLLEELSADSGPYESKSEAVRNFIQAGEERHELREEIERLRERLEAREHRVEDLEEQLSKRSQLEGKIEDLPDKIRDTGSYQERRQRLLDQATVTQRLKWKLTGVPVDDLDDAE